MRAARRVPWQQWVSVAARLILGAVLLIAGAIKAASFEESVFATRSYRILPFDLTALVGYALPVIEIIAGLLLILGLFTRVAAIVGGLLMLAFIGAIASVWARGLSIDCGCFGGGGARGTFDLWLYFWEIVRDTGLLLCAAWLVWKPASPLAIDNWLFRRDFDDDDADFDDEFDDDDDRYDDVDDDDRWDDEDDDHDAGVRSPRVTKRRTKRTV